MMNILSLIVMSAMIINLYENGIPADSRMAGGGACVMRCGEKDAGAAGGMVH